MCKQQQRQPQQTIDVFSFWVDPPPGGGAAQHVASATKEPSRLPGGTGAHLKVGVQFGSVRRRDRQRHLAADFLCLASRGTCSDVFRHVPPPLRPRYREGSIAHLNYVCKSTAAICIFLCRFGFFHLFTLLVLLLSLVSLFFLRRPVNTDANLHTVHISCR